MRTAARIFVLVLVVALLAAGWDFSRFVDRADQAVTPDPPINADAVTALTGASNARIIAAVQLADSLQLPLLISGVHVDTTAADIAEITGVDVTEIQCCVTLGRAAATTEGNGSEVAEWARRHNVMRIIVVTSEYHMDRALLELRRAMPEAYFIPHAVTTTKVRPADWHRDPATARRLVEEWAKFRIAAIRPAPPPAEPLTSAKPTPDRAA
ncbi:MAG: YdcF family protein [Hyphomonadaceae bacterium]|nr:YdcF family protein [Hyphomonadaceae bacterium]